MTTPLEITPLSVDPLTVDPLTVALIGTGGGGGGGSYNLTDVTTILDPDLEGYTDAQEVTSITNTGPGGSGGKIAAFTNTSGNGAIARTNFLNGHDVLDFTTQARKLVATSVTGNKFLSEGASTAFFVFRHNSLVSNHTLWRFGQGVGAQYCAYYPELGGTTFFDHGNQAGLRISTSVPASNWADVWQVVATRHEDPLSSFWHYGTKFFEAAATGTWNDGFSSTMNFGGHTENNANGFRGEIAWASWHDAAFSDADIIAQNAFLASKFGLSAP